MHQAGWSGPIKDFVEEDRLIVRKALETFIHDAGASQVLAWRDSIQKHGNICLSVELRTLLKSIHPSENKGLFQPLKSF